MKLFGALIAACAAAAIIPYRAEYDRENKTFKAKSLTYELETTVKADGEKSIKINILPDFCKDKRENKEPDVFEGECREDPEEKDDAVMCNLSCENCENLFNCPEDAKDAPPQEDEKKDPQQEDEKKDPQQEDENKENKENNENNENE